MKYTDIVMVVENYKGWERNSLMTEMDAQKKNLDEKSVTGSELAGFFMELGKTKMETDEPGKAAWATVYLRPDYTFSMSYCHNQMEILDFLQGKFNDSPDDYEFDRGECSETCLRFLSANKISEEGKLLGYPECTYEAVPHAFKQGEEILNLNGCRYKILQCLSKDNLLLMDVKSGQFAVGIGTKMYLRRMKEMPEADPVVGVEWEHGIYLGNMPSQIDFRLIRQEYGPQEEIINIYVYRHALRERFLDLEKITENKNLPVSVRKAANTALYECFMTGKRETFSDNLDKGEYDSGFLKTPGQEKEQKR